MDEFESLRGVEDEGAVSDNNEDADGDKVDKDADKVEQLIECVRRRSILFDLTSKNNKNTAKKELKWVAVATEMNEEGKQLFQ